MHFFLIKYRLGLVNRAFPNKYNFVFGKKPWIVFINLYGPTQHLGSNLVNEHFQTLTNKREQL